MRMSRAASIFAACAMIWFAGCHARQGSPAQRTSARSNTGDHRAGRAAVGEATAVEPLDYVEYRIQPELGQISIVLGSVEGARTVERVGKSAGALARKGILVCSGEAPRAVYRTGTFNGHRIDTLIVALPPRDPDEADAGWSRWLLMKVDGRLKVECSLGDAGTEANLFVFGVQVFPDDDLISFSATDLEGNELVVPGEACSLDDHTLITNESFEEASEEDPVPEGAVLVRI